MTTTPSTFRKKPVEVEAMQLGPTAQDTNALCKWLNDNGYPMLFGDANRPETLSDTLSVLNSWPRDRVAKGWYTDPSDGAPVIRTLEGDMRVSPGDYVIRGVKGEFYPCKPDVFEATYEIAHEEPTRKTALDRLDEWEHKQEPTDAEVEAAALEQGTLYALQEFGLPLSEHGTIKKRLADMVTRSPDAWAEGKEMARRILKAARAARRGEEQR
ncbi:hypothetical protein ACXET9_07170 [Brachybacterium sp. DNPG3]